MYCHYNSRGKLQLCRSPICMGTPSLLHAEMINDNGSKFS